MEVGNDDISLNKLNGILLDAMNQSRALFNKLEQQSKTIKHLRRENEQLRRGSLASKDSLAGTTQDDDVSARIDYLFHQNAAKQAEIDRLKTELRTVGKNRPRKATRDSQSVMPVTSSDGIESTSISRPSRASSPAVTSLRPATSKRAREETPQHGSSPEQKRARSEVDTRVLQELPNNTVNNEQRLHDRKGRDRSMRGAEAIPTVAEDGEDHNRKENWEIRTEFATANKHPGAHRRLDALLSAASPVTSALVRPEHLAAKSVSPRTPAPKPPTLVKSSSDVAARSTAGQQSGLRFLRPTRHREHAPEDDEPLRSRPLHKLNLSHFKLNPTYYQQYEAASEGHGQSKDMKKCLPRCTRLECCGSHIRALVLTLGPDLRLSDDDLLLDFLGLGSEKKIINLTPVARENLLHEARVKRVANEYGRMHRGGRDRATSPSGFWNTDLPGSQEAKNHLEEARQWERGEVERRHQEACKHEGRWVFADE